MKLLITGGTGLIGRALISKLAEHRHEMTVLSRQPAPGLPQSTTVLEWDASTVGSWGRALESCDAVINLAGESLGAGRWTKRQKEKIRTSRINATNALVHAIGKGTRKPKVFLHASAVGYYGHVDEGDVVESHAPGSDFLADVCIRWEEAAKAVLQHSVRLVVLRQGFVLANKANAFKRMQLPFKLFAGGPYGSGRQWFPWVHIEDVVGAYRFALEHSSLSGPVNVVAPNPVRVKELARELGKAMRRPSFAPAPSIALRLVLGEMADLLLKGQRVLPRKLLEAGYAFKFHHLPDALKDVLD